MTCQEKINLIIKGIVTARKQDPENPFIQLYLTNKNKLAHIDIDEVTAILKDLQDKEGILKTEGPHFPELAQGEHYSKSLLSEKIYFDLELLDGFDNWHTHYCSVQKSTLKDLLLSNLAKIYDVATKIHERIELSPSNRIDIEPLAYTDNIFEVVSEYGATTIPDLEKCRIEALTYLKQKEVIWNFSVFDRIPYDGKPGKCVSINVNVVSLKRFMPEITEAYQEKIAKKYPKPTAKKKRASSKKPHKAKAPSNQKEIVYEITYSIDNKILLNEATLISQPQFDSENDVVFRYLIEHPNQTFTQKQIAEASERTIGKSFHKTVENLGFKGELRRLFFKVSEKSIRLTNPIYQETIDELKIDCSQLPQHPDPN